MNGRDGLENMGERDRPRSNSNRLSTLATWTSTNASDLGSAPLIPASEIGLRINQDCRHEHGHISRAPENGRQLATGQSIGPMMDLSPCT